MSEGDPTRYDMPPVRAGEVPPGGAGELPPGDLPPPPDRRPWVIGGLAAFILIVAVALLLLGDDDDDEVATDLSTSSTSSSLPAVTTSSTTSTTSTTAAVASSTTEIPATTIAAPVEPPTTAVPAPTTTVPPPPVTLNPVLCTAAGDNPARPDFAAHAVHEAFLRGDENCAAALMTEDARRALFALTPASRQLQDCTEQGGVNPPTACIFVGPDTTELHFIMNFSDADDVWRVFQVIESGG